MLGELIIWVREFYTRKLVKFLDCKTYYDTMPWEQLAPEAEWLLGSSVKALPFMLIFGRCYAVFYEMTERAGCAHYLDDEQRKQLIIATIEVKEEILRRTPASTLERVQNLVLKLCKTVRENGHYKKASDLIRDSNRDYKGTFRPVRKVVMHKASSRMH